MSTSTSSNRIDPLDLEREFGLSEGNIFPGELSLEQLFFLRPVAGWARFRTPIKNLYICGSAAHPGVGIMGAPLRQPRPTTSEPRCCR
jgi:phytoene dehydrogenase-like protein